MSINEGKFKCPECGGKNIFVFKKWTYRDEIINNSRVRKWIFYEEKAENWKYCVFTSLYIEKIIEYTKEFCRNIIFCFCILLPLFLVYLILTIVFSLVLYILIFIWIDLYYCCSKKIIIYIEKNKEYILNAKNAHEIWEYNIKGKTEEEYNSLFKSYFICPKCKKTYNSFIPFIDDQDVNRTTNFEESKLDIKIDIKNKNLESNDYITVHFVDSKGLKIDFTCNKKEKISNVLKRLYWVNKKYKNQKCVFLFAGSNLLLDKEKTLENINFKENDKIVIMLND